jgi:hypothetical protein
MGYLSTKLLLGIFLFSAVQCGSFFLSRIPSLRLKLSNLRADNSNFDDDFFGNENQISKGFLPTAYFRQDDLTIKELCSIKWLLHFKQSAAEEANNPSKFFTKFDDDFGLYTNGLGNMIWKV